MHDAKMVLNAVISDCKVYWDNYYEMGIIAGAVLVVLYCLILLCQFFRYRNEKKGSSILSACRKLPLVALLGFYCYLVLGITVLSRTKEAAYILRPVPFSTWGTDVSSLKFWIENILMMIPFGILLYILWKPFRKIRWSLLAGGLFSLTIECIQLLARLGKFETDDIMNNVFGMLIGILLCKGINRIFSALKNIY